MRRLAAIAFGCIAGCAGCAATPAPAEMWLTTADENQKLTPQPPQFRVGRASGDEAVTIDTSSISRRCTASAQQ